MIGKILREVLIGHTFTAKAGCYRVGAALITMGWAWFWTGSPFEALEIMITVMATKHVWYGLWEYRNHGRSQNDTTV